MNSAEKKALIKRMDDLRSLLREFGVRLSGYDPGISAVGPTGNLDFGKREWDFMEPLLIELRAKPTPEKERGKP